ncbi:acyl-CoA dehydrogenase [Sphingomonas sp. DBB INV C78]|uniref:acyl-CoA dehydrogenase family protein n=1 Tax=Sphingomonas sp. DBB INV C78 TaxID=3349434 RepID=UPI0036D43FB0
MTRDELLEPFDRLLEDSCPPSVARAIEAGGSSTALWTLIDASGFLDALVPEDAGGAGLSLADAAPLLMALGRHAVPLPVGETMIARALIAGKRSEQPSGPVLLVPEHCSAPIPMARAAGDALVQFGDHYILAPLAQAELVPASTSDPLTAILRWPARLKGPSFPASRDLRELAAIVASAAIAGAAGRLLEMTIAYANDRTQFGKPIARQQAVQQQMAVMAEQVIAARMAAEIGCRAGISGGRAAAATAKCRASAAALVVADIAHAIHGAIGISEESDVQLYSRRLREWRLAGGSEGYWASELGRLRLAAPALSSVNFVRRHITDTDMAA